MVRDGVADLGVGMGCRRRGLGDLLAAVGAQVEHAQLGEPAEPQPAEQPRPVAQVGRPRHPDRQPLVVRPVGAGAAAQVVALGPGLVVLRAAAPLVVGDLVVVPGDDPGVAGVQVLQVAVALVLGVPAAVVGQAHHLPRRVVRPDVLVVGAVAVLAGGVLVEVVAQAQHGVQVVARREVAVGGEPAGLQVGARHHAEAEVARRRVVGRRGPGAAGPAVHAVPAEAVVVAGRRPEPGDVDLDGVVAARAGGEAAGADDVAEAGVAGDLPADAHPRAGARAGRGGAGGGDPGPDHDRGGARVAGGDAVGEDLGATVGGIGRGAGADHGGGTRGGRAGGQDGTSGERAHDPSTSDGRRCNASEVEVRAQRASKPRSSVAGRRPPDRRPAPVTSGAGPP